MRRAGLLLIPSITGSTLVAGVIGWPVRHSRSPAIHNAACAATGTDMVYGAFPVAPGDAGLAVAAMRTLGIRGLSVTMPHKAEVLTELDAISDSARALGAVNCITNDGGVLSGDNTDGEGFLIGLEHDTGMTVAGKRVVVVGAGGAARAIIRACGVGGAAEVVVMNRTRERISEAVALAGDVGREAQGGELATADLIVNATSIGMSGGETDGELPFSAVDVGGHSVVVDIVYDPLVTPLLSSLVGAGVSAFGGLSMLAGQAAAQFERWTGRPAPFEVMLDAARTNQ